MFNLDALSLATENARAADLLREADRERASAALAKSAAGSPAIARVLEGSWRAATDRLSRMAAGLAASPKRPQPAAQRS